MEKEQEEKILGEIFELTNNISNNNKKFSYLDFLIDIKFFVQKTTSLFIAPTPLDATQSNFIAALSNQKEYQKYGEWTIFIAHLTRLYGIIQIFETGNQISNTEVIKEIKDRIVWLTSWLKNFIYKKNNTQELSKNIFINPANSAQPIHLKSFKIKEYQNLRDISINDIPVDAQFVVFTGDNGEGKTNILRALTVGMYGNIDENSNKFLIPRGDTYIFIEAKYNNHSVINEFKGITSTDTFITKTFNIVAYGASRLQLQGAMTQAREAQILSPIHGLFEDNGMLLSIVDWINAPSYPTNNIGLDENPFDYTKQRGESICNILNKILPSVEVILKDELNIEFQQKNAGQNDAKNRSIDVKDLSAGNKSILAMIGDMMVRLFKQQPKVVEVSDLQGIVLIDELETHLHPKWQLKLPSLLAECFPKVQFIVTTHSPIIVLGMPENTVYYNVNKDKGETTVEKVDIDVSNLLPNQVLTSPIFNMESILSVQNKNIGEVRTENTYDEIIQRDEVRKKLREIAEKLQQKP